MVAARLALCYSHTRSHILAILSCNGDLQYLFANSICERSHSHYPKSIVEVCRSSSQDRRFRAIALLRKSVRGETYPKREQLEAGGVVRSYLRIWIRIPHWLAWTWLSRKLQVSSGFVHGVAAPTKSLIFHARNRRGEDRMDDGTFSIPHYMCYAHVLRHSRHTCKNVLISVYRRWNRNAALQCLQSGGGMVLITIIPCEIGGFRHETAVKI